MQCLVLSLGKSCLLKKSIVVTPTNCKVTACPYPKNIRVDYFWHFGNTISSKKSKWCLYLQAKSQARFTSKEGREREEGRRWKRKIELRQNIPLFMWSANIHKKLSMWETVLLFSLEMTTLDHLSLSAAAKQRTGSGQNRWTLLGLPLSAS